MTETAQEIILIGMDAHSEKIALCITRWRHGSDPVVVKQITTTLASLESTYAKQAPAGALTVLEASTNAFSIVRRLEAIGQRAEVLASDTLSGRARADRINDRIDSRNLACAYARGGTRRVHVPSARHLQWRDLFFGYRNAVKDSVRWSNRIWAFCSGHGLKLPRRSFRRKIASVRQDVLTHRWTPEETFHVETLLLEYEHSLSLRTRYEQRIVRIVSESPEMTRLMQLLGVRFIVAFALVAFVEDVHRFADPKKLVGYIGLNPTVLASGKSAGPRNLSRYGRSDLKALLVEAAQCVLRKGNDDMAKWARRKIAAGKNRNVLACALARKLTMRAWHILMDHPVPNREGERSFRLKLAKLASVVGREHLAALGYKKPAEYVEAVCARIYTPETLAELQTAAPASA
ncbi:MAG: IS110 family transposase [Candidatus Marinimicrobia bacterium]|nr:IS110 family transposase [Candidatus Neomarinimicrobiota bacterium]